MNKNIVIKSSIFLISIILVTTLTSTSIYGVSVKHSLGSIQEVVLTVLVDNNENGSLSAPWGLSILVETNDTTILFDSGPDPEALQNNVEALGKDLSEVDYAILSHAHPDHYDGFEHIGNVQPNTTVYVPTDMPQIIIDDINEMNVEQVPNNETTNLSPGIAFIGLPCQYGYELSLVINIEGGGAAILVGCSHPGVVNIVEKAVQELGINPYLLIGGFHILTASQETLENTTFDLIELGLDVICPVHCSGVLIREYIEDNYPDYYLNGCVGTTIKLNEDTMNPQENTILFTSVIAVLIILPIINKQRRRKRNN